eukprot:3941931-Rhodomonas_salina.3
MLPASRSLAGERAAVGQRLAAKRRKFARQGALFLNVFPLSTCAMGCEVLKGYAYPRADPVVGNHGRRNLRVGRGVCGVGARGDGRAAYARGDLALGRAGRARGECGPQGHVLALGGGGTSRSATSYCPMHLLC